MRHIETEIEGLKLKIPNDVYSIAEDSLMLSEVAKRLAVKKVLEIGCGSGLNSLLAAKNSEEVMGVDINPSAVNASKENARINAIKNVHFFESDLFSNLNKQKYENYFDVILFNPPYLPTNKEDKIEGNLNHAYDGGVDGRVILDRFLDKFDIFLEKNNGKLYLIQSNLNNLDLTLKKIKDKNFETKIIKELSFFFEKIYLIEAKRNNKESAKL